MPLLTRKWHFLDYIVGSAPKDHGVYALWRGNELVLVAITGPKEDIRTCLLRHMGDERIVSAEVDHFSWELPSDPQARRDELLESYKNAHGRLPIGHSKGFDPD